MLVVAWMVFLHGMLFLLGSAVGSFLNVCIVRLPQGRSLLHPPSSCGRCGQHIRMQDNIPLLSYWLLGGRCRACGAAFSMRYFWIELLTGLAFVLIYYLEIARNVHHFLFLSWYDSDYEYLLMEVFQPRPWLVFAVHALLVCVLIVAAMTNHESHKVPRSVTVSGVLLGLLAAMLFPWPWPDEATQAISPPAGSSASFERVQKPYSWGPHLGAMPADAPWWVGDITPRSGLYPWPVWGPLPAWLPPGSHLLGLATGIAGFLTGLILLGLVRLGFNIGASSSVIGWGEIDLLMIAGAFLGWQPIVVAGLLGLIPGLIAATRRCRAGKPAAFSMWLAPAVAAIWLSWYWIAPLVQGFFFHPERLLFAGLSLAAILVLLASFRLLRRAARR